MIKMFFIFLFYTASALASDHLTLYFIPSPHGMDWSSPKNLAWSVLKNKISMQPHFIGHVFVELQCGDRRELTGMTGRNNDYVYQLLIESRGFGILYHSFDGRMEDKAEVQAELDEYLKEGDGINFVRFKVNDGQCKRLTTYLDEYRANDVGKYYGLANRPLYGEGSGCSAFGASFLEVGGLLNEEIREEWSHTIMVPMKYSGPPLREEGVSLLSLMLNADSWAKENEDHRKLFYWEPDRMFDWVEKKIKSGSSVLELGKVKGVLIDASGKPVPTGPIWKQDSN